MVRSPGDLQLADAGLLHFLGFESHGGIVGDVEEMIAHQVFVSVGFAGIHGGYVDRDIHAGLADILIVKNNRAGYFAEGSPRTVEIARCRTANCADECAGSSCQAEVAAEAGSERSAARPR